MLRRSIVLRSALLTARDLVGGLLLARGVAAALKHTNGAHKPREED